LDPPPSATPSPSRRSPVDRSDPVGLVGGRQQLQFVARLASINENEAHPDGAIEAREHFWHHAAQRLGRLFRLTDRDLDQIEACLAERIGPRPLPQVAHLGKVQAAE
jgi:hypothetical protein